MGPAMSARRAVLAGAVLLAACTTAKAPAPDTDSARSAWASACNDFDEWDKPGPPFRIHGNTYYVGTCGIAAILVANAAGHTLIDTGTDRGAEIVLANIRALRFDPRDVAAILTSHEHFDHVGGIARVQAATGATVVTSKAAEAVLRTGRTAADDPQAGSGHPPFPPATGPIRLVDERASARSAAPGFTAIPTPGHTNGALSWRWRSCDGAGCRWIVYADSMNPISDDAYRFSDHPSLVTAFRKGIADLAASPCDILLTPHPGSSNLRRRVAGEAPLVDSTGCRAYAASVSERLDARLAKEAAGE